MKYSISLRDVLSLGLVAYSTVANACEVCESDKDVTMERLVRRMQPDAKGATTKPNAALEWGQINFLHTTDTHGWLSGHVKEENYGADWGDYVSFIKKMRQKADNNKVDLLVVDTGDLHDGNGLSDAEVQYGKVNGERSNKIFQNLDYDLLTIGNHELYVSDIAYETYNKFAKFYGDKYLTSNVDIYDPKQNGFVSLGARYRKFTTKNGIKITALGVLFDFTGASNVTKITTAADMVKQEWFQEAIKDEPDMFVVVGHNPVRVGDKGGSFPTVYNALRQAHKTTPIQMFGGHKHVRDFAVYDETATGLASGRYCETLGWLSMSGVKCQGGKKCPRSPRGLPNPCRPAKNTTESKDAVMYSRRYLDWNRLTMEYHTKGEKLDTDAGKRVTKEIWNARKQLNLTSSFGCVPETFCMTCVPQTDKNSIFPIMEDALKTIVVNETRKANPRVVIANTGTIRFDMIKGPFTVDDSYIVSPFEDAFQYLPDVDWKMAQKVLAILNTGPPKRKRSLDADAVELHYIHDEDKPLEAEECPEPLVIDDHMLSFDPELKRRMRKITKRQKKVSAGYTTTDDWGTGGDDTPHSTIPKFPVTNCVQARVNFPASNEPEKVDVVFVDFIAPEVVKALNANGGTYKIEDVGYYMPKAYTTNDYLSDYVKQKWGDKKDC